MELFLNTYSWNNWHLRIVHW